MRPRNLSGPFFLGRGGSMDRAAVFVDAGYLFAAGAALLSGEKVSRSLVRIENRVLANQLERLAVELTGLPLLRIYWYDGTSTGPTPSQLALAYAPDVKLRLGFVNQQGQQKGVDSLIVSDLINLSRNRAMADAVLLTGDEDIRVGVQQAQEFGVRVHLLGIAPSKRNQSNFLLQEADRTHEWGLEKVRTFMSLSTPPADPLVSPVPAPAHLPVVALGLEELARRIAEDLTDVERAAIVAGANQRNVPPEIDRRLLLEGSRAIGEEALSPAQKRELRGAFLAACRSVQP